MPNDYPCSTGTNTCIFILRLGYNMDGVSIAVTRNPSQLQLSLLCYWSCQADHIYIHLYSLAAYYRGQTKKYARAFSKKKEHTCGSSVRVLSCLQTLLARNFSIDHSKTVFLWHRILSFPCQNWFWTFSMTVYFQAFSFTNAAEFTVG